MRRWAKAQSDFASDFVRHVSTTKLKELAGVDIPSSQVVSPSFQMRSSSAPKNFSTLITPTSPAPNPPETHNLKTRRLKSRERDSISLSLSSESQEDSTESQDEEKTKRIQSIQTKLLYYRKKVNDLEEELNLLLGNPQKGPLQHIPITSSGDSFSMEPITKAPLPPQLLADLHEGTASESDLHSSRKQQQQQQQTSTPTSPTRPSSSRPSDRQILSRAKLSIDKAWTIDPSQVQIDKQLGG